VLGDQVGREGWLASSPPGARRALRCPRGFRPFRCELCLSRPLAGVLLASCSTPMCSAPGDARGGFLGTAEIRTQGSSLLFSFASQFVRVDRAVVAVGAVAVGTEEPTADRAALLQILVDGVSDQST
jgi:hypothetical protein